MEVRTDDRPLRDRRRRAGPAPALRHSGSSFTLSPAGVARVLVADNGRPGEHRTVYHCDWPFELDVLDLGHDIGIGACRAALTDAVTEPYLWMGDCDMEFPSGRADLARLREVLDSDPELGGVAGWLLEDGTVRAGARDLDTVGVTAVKTAATADVDPDPHPHARFDFVPHGGLFRTDIYDTYDYDPEIVSREHLDFFIGHAEAGEWAFASTPSVQVLHHNHVDDEYRRQRGGGQTDAQRLADKWGVRSTVPGAPSDWVPAADRTTGERLFGLFRRATPPGVWVRVRHALVGASV
jgi:hypothetical protein